MYELIILLFDICRFKKGPEDLPYSLALLKMTASGFALIQVLLNYRGNNLAASLLEAATGLIYVGAFGVLMLQANRHLNRFYQVASALYGCFALLAFIAWPVVMVLAVGQPGGLAFILLIAFIIWFGAVTAHIVNHALAPNLAAGLGWSLAFLVGYTLLSMSFGHIEGIA